MLLVAVPGHHVFKHLQIPPNPIWFHLVPKPKTGHTGVCLTPTLETSCLIRDSFRARRRVTRRKIKRPALIPELYLNGKAA
jgi:hypothetical protein